MQKCLIMIRNFKTEIFFRDNMYNIIKMVKDHLVTILKFNKKVNVSGNIINKQKNKN